MKREQVIEQLRDAKQAELTAWTRYQRSKDAFVVASAERASANKGLRAATRRRQRIEAKL